MYKIEKAKIKIGNPSANLNRERPTRHDSITNYIVLIEARTRDAMVKAEERLELILL